MFTKSKLLIVLMTAAALATPLAAQPIAEFSPKIALSSQSFDESGCAQPSSLTLSQAVSRALCANPSTRSNQFRVEAANQRTNLAKSAYLPKVSASAAKSAGSNDSKAHQLAIGVDWLLWDFGARAANLEASQLTAMQTNMDEIAHQHALAYSVVQAYMNVQSQLSLEESAQAQVKAATEALTLAQARYDLGDATPLDVSLASNVLAQEDLALARVTTAKSDAFNHLALLLSMPPSSTSSMELETTDALSQLTEIPEKALETLIEDAKSTHPEILAAIAKTEALKSQSKAAKSAYLPTVTLSGQVQSTKSGSRATVNQNVVGVSVQIPIFTGGATTAQVRELNALANSAQMNAQGVKEDIENQIATTFQASRLMAAQIQAAERMVDSAEKARVQSMGQYRAGVGTMLDVLDSLTKSSQANSALTVAVLDGQLLRAKLAWQLGLMPVNQL